MFYHCKVISALNDNPNLPKASDSEGSTLLHFATADGNHRIMKYLIEMGADVDVQDSFGSTPLLLTLEKNRFWTTKILLDANADIYMKNYDGQSALETVLHEKSLGSGVLRLFFERVKSDCRTIEDIIDVMSSVDCPIYHAILWSNTVITKSRLDDGWKVNARDPKNNKTALHVAVRLSDLENVKFLLDNGANVNARDLYERTPLSHLNVTKDSDVNLEILRLLIARGAWLYKSDLNGRMQMCNIFESGVKKLVKALLDHGVSLSKMDKTGNTAVHYLASNKNEGCIDELEGRTFDANFNGEMTCTPLQKAVSAEMPGNVKFLLDNGADVNKTNWKFMTPLFYAVMTHTKSQMAIRNECVELLLQRGADAMCEGDGIHTVFHLIMTFKSYSLSKPILMHLAVQELLGTPITKVILDKIHSHEYLKRHLDLYRREMKKMQKSTVCESVTLFKFIAESDEKIVRYARNQKVVKRLVRMSTKRSSSTHCKRYLKRRVTKAIYRAQVKQQAAAAVSNIVKLGNGCYSGIVDRIADYLNDSDIKNLIAVRK